MAPNKRQRKKQNKIKKQGLLNPVQLFIPC